jgi:hypothetical protein
MARRKRTFAEEILYFAQSIDIVSDGILRDFRDLVWQYLKDQLDAQYFEIMCRTSVEGNLMLKAHWTSRDEGLIWSVRNPTGGYSNPIVAAYDADTPMWLVSPNDSPLAEAEKIQDQWTRTHDLAPYQPFVTQPIRTAVVVPIRRPPHYGVFFLETGASVGATEVGKDELLKLGEALGIMLELNGLNRTQARQTREAIRQLREILDSAEFPKLASPRLFFAFSDRADRSVTTVVKDVLSHYAGRIDVQDWDQMREAGDIPTQIKHAITRARFGVCYLSEPRRDAAGHADSAGAHTYLDNPNVVFESGMLQAQTSAYGSDGGATGWVPIRERNSPQAPFDFASERMLIVPRSTSGQLDERKLRDELERRFRSLLRE